MKRNGLAMINVRFDNHSNAKDILVKHTDKTFSFLRNHNQVSIIDNGDNSWSLVEGVFDQLAVNLIGTEIEKHYSK
ncbi:hypothetical protein HH214_09060 [Mucilaginibacter robiniae]|uniref:Uncharacterized protein n=1 Tax=Mucilaginibacter robiniae TaxID=2728022 RepID=A0A7L5E6K8_9SPHI|nr:hypothetical protein [Mucilaginibacter robiniae]QJD96016.1 hypothetical protein HH214_09060 [Mucilaginibacter robiniae]